MLKVEKELQEICDIILKLLGREGGPIAKASEARSKAFYHNMRAD